MNERERIIEIMKSQELNSKQLSLELGVSAGTISNILGGRNKPSLEFMQNIADHFPFINPTWLFVGFGEMYIDGYVPDNLRVEQDLFTQPDTSASIRNAHSLSSVGTTMQSHVMTEGSVLPSIPSPCRTIQKIVIFYSDGTFEER